jgi:hypothetical protein
MDLNMPEMNGNVATRREYFSGWHSTNSPLYTFRQR